MVNYKKKYLKYKLKYLNLLGGTNQQIAALMISLNKHNNQGEELTHIRDLLNLIEQDFHVVKFDEIKQFLDMDMFNYMEINDEKENIIKKQLVYDFNLCNYWFKKTNQHISLEFLNEISVYPNLGSLRNFAMFLNQNNLPPFIVMQELDIYPDLYQEIYERGEGNAGALENELEEAQELKKSNFITFYEKYAH
jgi:hypothetical protein